MHGVQIHNHAQYYGLEDSSYAVLLNLLEGCSIYRKLNSKTQPLLARESKGQNVFLLEMRYTPAPGDRVGGCAAGWPAHHNIKQQPQLSLHCTTAPTPVVPSPNHTQS